MWVTEPTFRGNPEILRGGLGGGCAARIDAGLFQRDCIASITNPATSFPGLVYPTPWYIPGANTYRDLFAGLDPPDEPYARLKSLGVLPVKGNPDFWLAGDFYLRDIRSEWAQSIDAFVFTLVPGAKKERTTNVGLASSCGFSGRYPNIPNCSYWNRNAGAYILWYRRGALSDAEAGDYWCQPKRQPDGTMKVEKPAWDPAKC
jgi:hypothetical protein